MKEFLILLKRYAMPYRWNVIWSIVFNVLAAFMTLFSFAFIIPILQMLFGINSLNYNYMEWGAASAKDVVINNFYFFTQTVIESRGASAALAMLAAMLVAMTLVKVGVAYLSNYFIVPLRNGVVRDLRREMYAKILSLPIGFFTNERKGDVMARITGDVSEIEASVMSSIDMIFKNPVMIVVCLVMMLIVSWQLTLFVLVLLPIAGIVMGRVGKFLKRKSLKAQQLWGQILSLIEETLGGLRVVKAFCAEEVMDTKFRSETQTFFRMNNNIQRRVYLAHPMSEFLGTAAIAVVLWFGGSLILSGRSGIDAASFIYYMVIFYSIINPAKDLSKAAYTIRKGMASMTRIDNILEAENHIADPAKPISELPSRSNCGVSIKGVSFAYESGRDVLADINIDIPAGATMALVGQSGSGKSTLADLVPRFWDPDRGEVLIGGINVKDYRVADLRSLIGFVNQEPILFNDTFFANIAFGMPEATPAQVEAAAKAANAHEFIMATEHGYQTNVGDRGCKLSGGQRQRISIARAILKNPAILILDEATSALDTESERLVQQALEHLMRNRTTIVIAHRLSTVTAASEICVLSAGKIVERGTHEQLIAQGAHYKHLVELQQV